VRIGIVGPTYPIKGGVAQHTTALAWRLAQAGHDVRLVSWAQQYPRRLYPGVQTVERPELAPFAPVDRVLSWKRPDTWLRAGRALRGVDLVVFAHITHVQVPPYLTMLLALRGSGTRTEIIGHNVLPHERSHGDRLLVGALLKAGDSIIVHSDSQAQLARSLTPKPVRSARLPPFMPDAFVSARPAPGEHRRLLFFGIVRPYKGVDILLQALARGPDGVRLRIAGEFWDGTGPTEQLAHRLGLDDRVELRPGYVPAEGVPDLFRDVDALVLPYRSATGSQAVWTAFQFGVPAIATRTGELTSDIIEDVDGLVVEPDDVDDLAAALKRFYQPGTPERMRANVTRVDPEPYWDQYLSTLLEGAGS
jgi:glycosyltransferase involved in cell wall biosynthesis